MTALIGTGPVVGPEGDERSLKRGCEVQQDCIVTAADHLTMSQAMVEVCIPYVAGTVSLFVSLTLCSLYYPSSHTGRLEFINYIPLTRTKVIRLPTSITHPHTPRPLW